jgi:hypothetical protein
VRLHEYCATIEEMAKKYQPPPMPKDPKAQPANEWHSFTVAKTKTDAKTKTNRERSLELLKQVIKDHDGTPYAARAQYEIARGFGVELRGHWDDPRRSKVKLPNL